MTEQPHEGGGFSFQDKRRIDPETGEVRDRSADPEPGEGDEAAATFERECREIGHPRCEHARLGAPRDRLADVREGKDAADLATMDNRDME